MGVQQYRVPMRSIVFKALILFTMLPYLAAMGTSSRRERAETDSSIRSTVLLVSNRTALHVRAVLNEHMEKVE